MKKNSEKNIESDIVKSLLSDEDNEIGTNFYTDTESIIISNNKKSDIIKTISIIVLSCMIVILAILIYFKYSEPKSKKVKSKDLYQEAYNYLKFKEDSKLNKLYCTKEITENTNEVSSKETTIYYFNGSEILTSIYHKEISLSSNYEDYFDEMKKNYEQSLEQDYQYPNVKKNIMSGENKILVTVITEKSEEENSLGLPIYVNYDDAKQALKDAEYICK